MDIKVTEFFKYKGFETFYKGQIGFISTISNIQTALFFPCGANFLFDGMASSTWSRTFRKTGGSCKRSSTRETNDYSIK